MNECSQALNLYHLIWTSQIPSILFLFCRWETKALRDEKICSLSHCCLVGERSQINNEASLTPKSECFSTILGGHSGIFCKVMNSLILIIQRIDQWSVSMRSLPQMEGYPKLIQGTSPILISLLSGETEIVSPLTLGRIVIISQFLSARKLLS